jgi:2-methylisocitrate lyase-like PEP mutase family enzyme
VESLDNPVNVLPGPGMTFEELSAMGVKRISVGSGLSRAALGAFMRAAKDMKENGAFDFGKNAAGFGELTKIFGE